MENPHVTMLGHLTGRLLLSREPYAVDIPAILDAAAATGTIIELNANPRRLDMDWRWWPTAKAKGVRCSINPDAHTTRGLKDLFFGIAIARKGWLTREDVINCLDTDKVREILNHKKNNA
jgi:DNA polymerase (family 10)